MDFPSENLQAQLEQKDFWDSLQRDILASNQKLSHKDYFAFIEMNFIFSLFFRGCNPLEIKAFQEVSGLEDYAYVLLFEISDLDKTNTTPSIDDLNLYYTIKNSLHNTGITVGPIIINRVFVLISHDTLYTDQQIQEEATNICKDIMNAIQASFDVNIKAGIGSMQSIQSIYHSYIDALACMYYSAENISTYLELQEKAFDQSIDYSETSKRLVEAIRLRKTEAYDYFGVIMNYIKPLNDNAKRNKIFEILVLANHAMQFDMQNEIKYIDYTSYVKQFMELKGDDIIEFAYQCFIYITSYVKQPSTIDYSNHIVKATREFLESHYTDDISLEDMATQVNISPQYFSKLIKKTTGFNFIDWLSMLRVKKAKELLTNTNLTVKEVCFMVGYKDPNYFSRIFKKRLGITPSEYVRTSSYLNNKS